MKPQADKVAEQEALVSEFVEENKPLLEDLGSSYAVLKTIYCQGAELMRSVGDELERVAKPTVEATDALSDALNEHPRVASKIARLEKERNSLRSDVQRINVAFKRLEFLVTEAKIRLEAHNDAARDEHAVRSAKETPEKLPWWKYLVFGRYWIGGVPSALPSAVREWPTASSQAISDREDYEKLLTWYEQNLEVLEKAVAGKQAGEFGDWSQVIDELLDRMGWCDRHMDTIEQRNADMAGSELVTRRESLVVRRAETGQ